MGERSAAVYHRSIRLSSYSLSSIVECVGNDPQRNGRVRARDLLLSCRTRGRVVLDDH